MSFGRQVTGSTGNMTMVAAESLGNMGWKTGAITLDWTAVPMVATDTVLADGNTIKAGTRGLIYGTVLSKILAGATTGYFAPYTAAPPGATTLNGTTTVAATSLVLASGASIYAGDMLTIDSGGNIEVFRVASITGNNVTSLTPLVFGHTSGVAVSKVNEGRAGLVSGETFVLNATVLQTPPLTLGAFATNYPAGIYSGKVWGARLQVGGTNQPTLAALLAAMPGLFPVEMA